MKQKLNRIALKNKGFLISLELSNNSNQRNVSTSGLIDTGATVTLIDFQIVKDLEISQRQIIETKGIDTASEEKKKAFGCHLNVFFHKESFIESRVIFKNIKVYFFPNSKLLSYGHAGVIIGRDILQYIDFTWKGTTGSVTIDSISPIENLGA